MKAPGFLDAHLAANALAQFDNAGATFLALAPAVASGDPSQLISKYAQPVIDVHNVPPNTTLMLVRGGRVVNSIITGPAPLGFISLEDNVGVPAPGSYTYQVVQSEPNQCR